jgi:hypothetical protein
MCEALSSILSLAEIGENATKLQPPLEASSSFLNFLKKFLYRFVSSLSFLVG